MCHFPRPLSLYLDTSPDKTKKDINLQVASFDWPSYARKNDVFLFGISFFADFSDSPKVDYRFQTNDIFSQPLSVCLRTCPDQTRKDIDLQVVPLKCWGYGQNDNIFLLTLCSKLKELQSVKFGSQICHFDTTPVSLRGRLSWQDQVR